VSAATGPAGIASRFPHPAALEAAMFKPLLIGLALVFFVSYPAAQQTPSAEKSAGSISGAIPLDAVQKSNPVKMTADSVARGKRQYGYDCAMCHGKIGDGKGDVATDLKLAVSDFTNPGALKNRTDGELFYIIKNGRGQMPPEGDRGNPKLIWDMVNYVRWLSNQKNDLPKEEKREADDAK
jgi:mono/diheme cytochrome c family protein